MTENELIEDIVNNAPQIFVREQVNGKWGSYALTELPVQQAIANALRLYQRGFAPFKIKRRKNDDVHLEHETGSS